MVFWVRKVFGTFEKEAPGHLPTGLFVECISLSTQTVFNTLCKYAKVKPPSLSTKIGKYDQR